MKKFGAVLVFVLASAAASASHAATAINMDSEPRTITVTEGGNRVEVVIPAGETAQICPSGCFVTMPDGDRAALTGSETIEISGGKGRVR
ncbi:MAG: hypothetical protein KF849_09785 [Rhizobiaceae bacterium]|nr:hypothetical protein [Rhizobiaceae bacterium]